jgi:hypothetical protein
LTGRPRDDSPINVVVFANINWDLLYGLADSFGVGGDRLKVEPSGSVAVERGN